MNMQLIETLEHNIEELIQSKSEYSNDILKLQNKLLNTFDLEQREFIIHNINIFREYIEYLCDQIMHYRNMIYKISS